VDEVFHQYYFVDREIERSLQAGWFLIRALIDGTLFVVFSMPHNESGFKGPTNGTLKV